MMAAPLIAGNDVSTMDAATRDILLNREVIAVDQDARGVQGRRVARDGDREVWVKPLAGGARAVLLFNRGSTATEIAVDWSQLDVAPAARLKLRDLWAKRDLGVVTRRYAATVAPHDVVMLRVQP
jgi:alpha-galactosidase